MSYVRSVVKPSIQRRSSFITIWTCILERLGIVWEDSYINRVLCVCVCVFYVSYLTVVLNVCVYVRVCLACIFVSLYCIVLYCKGCYEHSIFLSRTFQQSSQYHGDVRNYLSTIKCSLAMETFFCMVQSPI